MAQDRLEVQIVGSDGVTRVFREIGASGQKMGADLESASNRAGDAADSLKNRYIAVGAGVGTLLGAVSAMGQAHVSEERQIVALGRAYGDQADEIEEMAASLQELGIATDDQVRISALGAQSLITNYGLTAEQINQLIERSADLSAVTFDQQGNQLQLADVMQRVSGAIRGEGEAAELLGLAMSDSAVQAAAAAAGLTGWNTTMTESEKAAFRFQLVLEQSSHVQGVAAEQSDSLTGRLRGMRMEVTDMASSFGGMLGPVGEASAVFGDLALIAPVVGAGIGKITAAAKAAQLGTAALALATGPVGMVAALAAGAGAVYLLTRNQNDAEKQARALAEATDVYTQSINDNTTALIAAGAYQAYKATADALAQVGEYGMEAQARIDDLAGSWEVVANTLDGGVLSAPIDALLDGLLTADKETRDYVEWVLRMNDVNQDGTLTAQEYANAQLQLASGFEATKSQMAEITTLHSGLMDEITNPDLAGSEIAAEAQRIIAAWQDSTMTFEEARAALQALEDDQSAYNLALRAEQAAQTSNAGAIDQVTLARMAQNEEQERTIALLEAEHDAIVANENAAQNAYMSWYYKNRRRGLEQDDAGGPVVEPPADAPPGVDYVTTETGVRAQGVLAGAEAARVALDAVGEAAAGKLAEGVAGIELAIAARERFTAAVTDKSAQITDAFQAEVDAVREYAESLAAAHEAITGQDWGLTQLAGGGNVSVDLALDTTGAEAALERTFRIAVGNTNKTAGLIDSVMDWGDELINVEGTYGKIDDLLAAGVISQDRYNMAQRAYNRMAVDSAQIQEDILTIQAKQAPYIAADVRNLERQYDLLADMEPSAARIALGWMDASQAAAALEFRTALLADAQDGLSDGSVTFWNSTIDGLEATNPGLLAMLETTGAVKRTLDEAGNWDGVSYEVNLEGVEDAKSELGELNDLLGSVVTALEITFDIDLNDDGVVGPGGVLDELKYQDGKVYKAKLEIEKPADPGINFNDWENYDFSGINVDIEVGADTTEATGEVDSAVIYADERRADFGVGADTSEATASVDSSVIYASERRVSYEVDADTTEADASAATSAAYADALSALIEVGADTTAADEAVNASVSAADGSSATITIDADTSLYDAAIAAIGFGRTIGTNYIDVVERRVGVGPDQQLATGGVVRASSVDRGGGVLVGEGGVPELLFPPAGSYVLNGAGTAREMAAGGGWHVDVNIGNINGSLADLEQDIAGTIGRGLAIAIKQQLTSLGMPG